MFRCRLLNKVRPLNLRYRLQMTSIWTWTTRACYLPHQDHQKAQNEILRKQSVYNQPDAALNLSRNLLGVERLKCGRQKPALPVSLTPGESAQLLIGGPRNSSPVQERDKKHYPAHKCPSSWWEQCQFDDRAATFVRCIVVEVIGRPQLEVFYQERLIPRKIDLHCSRSRPQTTFCASRQLQLKMLRKKISS